MISSLVASRDERESYIRATLDVLVPAQIRALRLREDWTQKQLADEADMKQARISAIETPGAVNFSLETLVRLAAAYRVGLQVRFVRNSQMLDWENGFSQDAFCVDPIEKDTAFLNASTSEESGDPSIWDTSFEQQKASPPPPTFTNRFDVGPPQQQNLVA